MMEHNEVDAQSQRPPQDSISGISAIARELSVSYQTAQRYLQSNQIPARRLGRLWIASRSALREWLASGEGQ